MITYVRHMTAPEVNACRWCGMSKWGHASAYMKSVGYHTWVAPTDAQRIARLKARSRKLQLLFDGSVV